MKIRTLLFAGLFLVAFTPLLVFMGLNMPRVLAQFKIAEENRQLLLVQKDAREIVTAMKWRQDSLRALGFNPGAIELVSDISRGIPKNVIRERVGAMVSRWYQDNPEILAVRLFDRQGHERFAIRRASDGQLLVLPEQEDKRKGPRSLAALTEMHPNSSVFYSGFEFVNDMGGGQHPVMRLGVQLLSQEKIVGTACLYFDLASLLQRYAGYLLQYNKGKHQYTHLTLPVSSTDYVDLSGETNPVEPVIIKDSNGHSQALIPLFADGHPSEYVLLAYSIKTGDTTAWVKKWRRQVIFLFGFVFLAVCFLALKFSAVIDTFLRELFAALQSMLHKQQPVTLSWSGPKEIKSMSRDLNTLSLQYIDSLKAQEEMRLETRKMESQLRQSQKMKALGLLAGGVAHDLNNILSGIVSYPQLLLLQLPEESDLRAPILEIQHSGERAAAVVADLLTVARGVAGNKECSDLNSLILEHLDSPECRAQKKHYPEISCVSHLCSEELPVLCSPVHIKKALMNLMINGAESIQGVGEVVVSTRKEQQAGNDLVGSDLQPGEYAILQVRDTGPGIEAEDLEHIFEPFYSKKEMGRSGTGLGLTVVWNTMTDHDGMVQVASSGEGTCFELFFPLFQGEEPVPAVKAAEKDLQGNGERILIIDDEAQQRDIAARILSAYGYKVESVASGEEAVEYLSTHESDLLLLDMIMDPGINGYETYRQILEVHPRQKAVIVSGFSESRVVEKTKKLGATEFVKKPYSIETLGQAIREALTKTENS